MLTPQGRAELESILDRALSVDEVLATIEAILAERQAEDYSLRARRARETRIGQLITEALNESSASSVPDDAGAVRGSRHVPAPSRSV